MGDQSSLDEDVVQENVHNNIVSGVNFTAHLPAATYNVLGIQSLSRLAAPTFSVRLFL